MIDKITDMFEIFVFYPFKALCVRLFNLFTNIQDLSMVINLFMKSVLPQVVNNSLRTVWKQNLEKMNLFLQVLFSLSKINPMMSLGLCKTAFERFKHKYMQFKAFNIYIF